MSPSAATRDEGMESPLVPETSEWYEDTRRDTPSIAIMS